MNTQALTTGTKRIVLGLLAISTVGMVALPVRADDAVVQTSVQESVNTGRGNRSIQNSSQESTIRRSRRGWSNYDDVSTGVVQDNAQYCDQLGRNNLCAQNTDQRSNIRHHRGRY